MDKQPCLPVKITAKKWADKLQDGSVFMRSLHDFGSWSAIKRHNSGNGQMKDGVQGDIGEGIARRVDPKIGDEFFNCFDPEVRSAMKGMFYIEAALLFSYQRSFFDSLQKLRSNDLSFQLILLYPS